MNAKLTFAVVLLGLSLGIWVALGRGGNAEPNPGSPPTLDTDKPRVPAAEFPAPEFPGVTDLASRSGTSRDYSRVAAPEFTGVTDWVNSKPLKLADQKGKAVVVHFWTNGCINCVHNYPHYRAWAQKYKDDRDLVVVGIHTPEFDAEKVVDRIRERTAKNHLTFAIAVDNEWTNWKAWGNRYWPTVYLVDKAGNVRYYWEGELGDDGYKKTTGQIDELLAEEALKVLTGK